MNAIEALQLIEQEMRQKSVEEVPDGYHAAEWWAEQWRKSECRARKILNRGVALGVMERREFRQQVYNRTPMVAHYKPVAKKRKP